MSNTKLRTLAFFTGEKKGSLVENEYLNLPDLHFFLFCQNKYKLNKGVYNTIDNWFYTYGIVPVIHRRLHILAFFEFVKKGESESNQHKYIRFGSGGLSSKLNQFILDTEKDEYKI